MVVVNTQAELKIEETIHDRWLTAAFSKSKDISTVGLNEGNWNDVRHRKAKTRGL